ncbi:S-Ena type endospore appendage [Priestia megaterium]|uniref:S-Ena type endospore appendage n=1 Tax=Priestia megaterium TaxID=1404 RepID=UPI0027300633|nr:S-Ena type endospore appendage [Priestia megaterium]MDP1443285.1 hypothetical protein [Priestia megaterium]MDP1472430.1 hypothetical protein [Priestia megaterium]
MGKRAKKICKQKSYGVARSCPEPRPTLNHPVYNRLCGNILLNDSVATIEIWKEEIERKATVTISVFNSSMSTSFIDVTIIRNCECPVELVVPSGNTISATVENAKSIIISKEYASILEGRYCLEVSFTIS